MPLSSISKWDNSPAFTSNFVIQTALMDFGDTSITKKVSAVTVSLLSDSVGIFTLEIEYRNRPSGSYTLIGMYGGQTSDAFQHTFTFPSPISCNHFQVRIRMTCANGIRVGINDISILYRKLRKYGVEARSTD